MSAEQTYTHTIHKGVKTTGWLDRDYCWCCEESWPCQSMKNEAAKRMLAALKEVQQYSYRGLGGATPADMNEIIELGEKMKFS